MSDPLVWQCIKNHNSFLRKQGVNPKRGSVIALSAEKGNLMSLNSYKHSGIANSKQIRFTNVESVTADGKKFNKIVMGLKTRKANKPTKSYTNTVVRAQSAKGANKVISANTTGNHYRKDLACAALKKWAALQNLKQSSAGISKPMTVKTGRK